MKVGDRVLLRCAVVLDGWLIGTVVQIDGWWRNEYVIEFDDPDWNPTKVDGPGRDVRVLSLLEEMAWAAR